MKIPHLSSEFTDKNFNDVIRNINDLSENINIDNMAGQVMKNVTIPANTVIKIGHSLQVIPSYRIILRQVGSSVITDGEFSNSFIELKNNGDEVVRLSIAVLR